MVLDSVAASAKRFVPDPLVPAARAVRSQIWEIAALPRLALIQRQQRKRYGDNLVFAVHPADEMCIFRYGSVSSRSKIEYFATAHRNIEELEIILADLGRQLTSDIVFLEFACGYGRLTRYFVTKLAPSQMTVSDINTQAVDFVTSTFGINGFYSVTDPSTLNHTGAYDIIFVASLFSHLPYATWGQWLTTLYKLLKPGGLLIFTTHGTYAYDSLNDALKSLLKPVVPGFSYLETNETLGRLDPSEYGSTFVKYRWVADFVQSHRVGTLAKFYPRGMWGYQDVYVITRRE